MAAHRYWRLLISASVSDATYVVVPELELHSTIGGADQTGSGTASADSEYPDWPASKAFDDLVIYTSGCWSNNSGGSFPHWLKYDFGSGQDKTIVEYTIQAHNDGAYLNQMPSDWEFQYSDNDSSWTTVDTRTGISSWSVSEVKTFTFSTLYLYGNAGLDVSTSGTLTADITYLVGDASIAVDSSGLMVPNRILLYSDGDIVFTDSATLSSRSLITDAIVISITMECLSGLGIQFYGDSSITIDSSGRLMVELKKLHEVIYGSELSFLHNTTYFGNPLILVHEQSWNCDLLLINESSYQSTLQLVFNHSAIYSGSEVFVVLHETEYSIAGSSSVTFIHSTEYAGSSSVTFIHATSYSSLPSLVFTHDVSYSGSTLLTLLHTTEYAAFDTIVFLHSTAYHASIDLCKLNEVVYGAFRELVFVNSCHYNVFIQPIVLVHETRYHCQQPTVLMPAADFYIEPNIQILSATITADENSSVYQCEVELQNAYDYFNFEYDDDFILHVLGTTYAFVVDGRSLNRSIDDVGHAVSSAKLSGLSPLCRYAAPRATPVTKVWNTSVMASAAVAEMVGAVTWTIVDWMIPAFRLSAEKAAPLDVAKSIVEAAGGLLESKPDGSIVARPRWPVSVPLMNTTTPDHTLTEQVIYVSEERPSTDAVIDRIRISDSSAGFQDRLEFEVNKDNPFEGWLYAYPSPWREGLRIATTRGSMIQLGALVEGTRTIEDRVATETEEATFAETLTFTAGQSSTAYPVMQLVAVEWLDENLCGLIVAPYSTTLEVTAAGTYQGYSLCKVSYITRYLKVPVVCQTSTTDIEAQFLLLEETTNG